MKRFTFRLQKLLEIRQKKEDQQRIVLAKASGEYQKELRKQEAIQENEQQLRERLKGIQNPTLSMLKWLDYYGWQSKHVKSDIQRELNRKKEIMEKALSVYTRLRQDKRAVEILKEKAWQAHQEATNKEEQHTLDEIAQSISNKNLISSDKQMEEEGGSRL